MDIKVTEAETFSDKIFGLILSKNLPPMLFKTRWGIHTFFLKRPIDVMVLDSKLIVRSIKTYLKPFRFYFYNPKYFLVVELVSGFVDKSRLKIGDKINFKISTNKIRKK